jgi:hypothetical protein
MATLTELRRGIVEFAGKGKILVMGDFNTRMGSLPNSINLMTGSQAPLVVARSSKDQTVSSMGRKVMAFLNNAGLVLLNGVREMAEYTTHGNTVIDLIWTQSGDLDAIEQLTVVEEKVKLSDHFLVTIALKLPGHAQHARPQPERADNYQMRWNVKSKGNPAHWNELRRVGNQLWLHGPQKRQAWAATRKRRLSVSGLAGWVTCEGLLSWV